MHTNAYAYTTAFTVHYDAFWMHSTAFTYIIRHRSASACTRASMQRPHKGVDAHGCAEVRGSVQDCTKNARGECTRMQMNARKKQHNARKRDAQTPAPLCARNPLFRGYVSYAHELDMKWWKPSDQFADAPRRTSSASSVELRARF